MVALPHMKKTTPARKKQAKAKQTKEIPIFHTYADLRAALLITSLLINLFVASLWIIVNLTSHYDQALIQFFLVR